MSAFRRGVIDDGVPPPVDPKDMVDGGGVERFIHQAADDPSTLAIKMTVYRVGDDTPFVRSLVRTAEAGKQVACVIELTATAPPSSLTGLKLSPAAAV